VKYAVIATVPLSEILKPSRRVNKSISNRIDAMVAAFVIIIIVFTFTLSYAAVKFVNAIVAPINALREICSLVTKDDLTGSLPSNATSLDMKVLLDAFANLMVALRFGSEKYQRGDKHLALEAFKEAHQLFSKTGMPICCADSIYDVIFS
jgi:nitrogen fixation/metabolism regulation signal transduction histidine kinase